MANKNTIRLTESELKMMIIESIKKMLKEGRNDEPSNTHYAIHKPSGKIVFSWDYSDVDGEELRAFKKDYFISDLMDMGMNPKEITILTRKSCEKRGINPTDDACWSNYPMTESIINEIGDTPRGQRALGALTARKKLARKDHMKPYSHAEKARGGDDWNKFAYPNATIDSVNPMYKDYAQGYFDYLTAHPEEQINYYLNESYGRTEEKTVIFSIGDALYGNDAFSSWLDENWESFPTEDIEASITFQNIPEDKGDYWTPPSGGYIDVYDVELVDNELLKYLRETLEPTFLHNLTATIISYVDKNAESLLQYEVDEPGPDPDEAYERYKERKYGL